MTPQPVVYYIAWDGKRAEANNLKEENELLGGYWLLHNICYIARMRCTHNFYYLSSLTFSPHLVSGALGRPEYNQGPTWSPV